MVGDGQFGRRGGVGGNVCWMGKREEGAFGALGEMCWEGEGMTHGGLN